MNPYLIQLQLLSVKAVRKIDYDLANELESIHNSFNQTLSRTPAHMQDYFSGRMCDVIIAFTHNILAMVNKL